MRTILLRILAACSLWLGLGLPASVAHAELIDFVNGTWNFGSGNVSGWQQPPLTSGDYSGTTTLSNGVTATVRVRDVGSVNHVASAGSAGHLGTSTIGGGSGLNLSQSSGSAYNVPLLSLSNYLRIDVSFSQAVDAMFFLHDIDRSPQNWTDAVYAESFAGIFGAVGTGTQANHTLGADLSTSTLHTQNLETILPNAGTNNVAESLVGSPTALTTNSAQIGFSTPVENFSLYYWNQDVLASNADNQSLFLTGFDATLPPPAAVPEPGSIALLSLAGACGWFWNRKRRPTAPSA